MAKETATQERVFEVADELAADGISVSSTVIRDRIGGGSFATIVKHLRAWENQRQTAGDDVQTMPPQLMSIGESLVTKIWGTAHKLAQDEVRNVKRLQLESESKFTARVGELLTEIGRLEHAEETRLQTITELQSALHDAELRVAEINERTRLLQQELTAAREHNDRIQQQLLVAAERASHLEGELSATKALATTGNVSTERSQSESKPADHPAPKKRSQDTV